MATQQVKGGPEMQIHKPGSLRLHPQLPHLACGRDKSPGRTWASLSPPQASNDYHQRKENFSKKKKKDKNYAMAATMGMKKRTVAEGGVGREGQDPVLGL